MHHFENFELEDFVLDNTFRNWVLRPNYELEAIVKEYLDKQPTKKKLVEEARVVVLALQVQEKTLPEKEWEQIFTQFKSSLQTESSTVEAKIHTSGKFKWFKYAAAAMLVAAASFFWWNNQSQKKVNDLQYVYQTVYGEIKKITLPDSTLVTLNANSKLVLGNVWTDSTDREVWLDGEAYFDVTKKINSGNKNFYVHTPKMDVQVLGTRFTVKTIRDFTRVVLTEGKVNINSPQKLHTAILMQPGEAVELKNKQVMPVKKAVQPEYYNAWVDKKFILNNTSLKDIAAFIKEYYGKEVKFDEESTSQLKLDGTSLPVEDEKTFLSIIEQAAGVHISQTKNEIFIGK
jgi:ferric-dicitrate binding protein FerR (iron transport regulator)